MVSDYIFFFLGTFLIPTNTKARDWQRSVRQHQAVKLPIKMAVKDVQEEADVLNTVELLSSPHDYPARLDLSTHGIQIMSL